MFPKPLVLSRRRFPAVPGRRRIDQPPHQPERAFRYRPIGYSRRARPPDTTQTLWVLLATDTLGLIRSSHTGSWPVATTIRTTHRDILRQPRSRAWVRIPAGCGGLSWRAGPDPRSVL